MTCGAETDAGADRGPAASEGAGTALSALLADPRALATTPVRSAVRASFRALAAGVALICLTHSAPAASGQESFQQGFEAYASGAYEQAATTFRQLTAQQPSFGAFHNLGNAEWKCGRVGEAVLAWERAHWLDPFSVNARVNLRYARKAAQLGSPELAWHEICSTWLPVNAWAWLATVSFWLAVGMVMLPGIFRWRKADWHQAVAAGCFAVFLLTLPALVGVGTRTRLGVIREKDTFLRLTPTTEAQTLGKLPAGDMVRLERRRGDFVYVRAGNDAAGWITRAQFGRVARP